jgi:uncharacterized protein
MTPSLRVGVADLRRHPGTRRRWTGTARLEGLVVSSSRVRHDAAVEIAVELEAISGGLVVEGLVRVPWEGECRRCLEPVRGLVEARVREVFEDRPTEGETYPLEPEEVDLAPMVRDAVLLALPLAPLCRAACSGPAPESFPTGPAATPERPPVDPRWAALDELRFADDGPES